MVGKSGGLKVMVLPRDFSEGFGDRVVGEGDGVRIAGKFKESEEFGDAFIAKSVLVCEAVG